MNRNKPKRRVIWLVGLFVVFALGTGSAWANGAKESRKSNSGKVTINLWEGFNGPEVTRLSAMIKKYWEPTHPNIVIENHGNKQPQAMLTAMAGGTPPDVAIGPGGSVVSLWAQKGAIMDISPLIAGWEKKLEAEQVEAGLQWAKYNGKFYAIPFVNFNYGLFYNKTMFKKAGLNPNDPPKTIAQLTADAKKLTIIGSNGDISQLGWMPINDQWRAANVALAFGGHWYNPKNGMPTANSPGILAAFKWDLGLAKQIGLSKVTSFTSGFTSGDNPFALGKAAMYVDGCWMPDFFKQSAPNLDYGVAPIPYSAPEYKDSNVVGTNPVMIPTGSQHPKEAAQVLEFFALNKELSSNYANVIYNIPQIKSQLSSFTTNPFTKMFARLSESPNAEAWAPVPYASEYGNELTKTMGQMYNQGIAPRVALDNLQKEMVSIAKSTP